MNITEQETHKIEKTIGIDEGELRQMLRIYLGLSGTDEIVFMFDVGRLDDLVVIKTIVTNEYDETNSTQTIEEFMKDQFGYP